MLFDRQKRLLALVDALGGRVASLDSKKFFSSTVRKPKKNQLTN